MSSRAARGTHVLTINGEDYTLRTTLAAYTKIENQFGSQRQVLTALAGINLAAATFIIGAAASLDKSGIRDLEENIFMHGVGEVTADLNGFLSDLFNPPSPKGGQSEGKPTTAEAKNPES